MESAIGPMGHQNVQLSGVITVAIVAVAASVVLIKQIRTAYVDGVIDGVVGRLRCRGPRPDDDGGYADGFADARRLD